MTCLKPGVWVPDLPVCIAVRRKAAVLATVFPASCLDPSAPPRACLTALRQPEQLHARPSRGSRSVVVNDSVHVELRGRWRRAESARAVLSGFFPPRHVFIPVTTLRGFYTARDTQYDENEGTFLMRMIIPEFDFI